MGNVIRIERLGDKDAERGFQLRQLLRARRALERALPDVVGPGVQGRALSFLRVALAEIDSELAKLGQ